MNKKTAPEWLPEEVSNLHRNILESWGPGWRTELLQRLMLPHMKATWLEISKRGSKHEVEYFNQTRSPYVYALCWDFFKIREEALEKHLTPTEKADRYQSIAKSAASLASAIDETRLDRVADGDLSVKRGGHTPTLGNLLIKLSAEAEILARSATSETNILPRPGGKHAARTYVIRRIAVLLDAYFGGKLHGTTADLASAILNDVVQVEHVNNALRNWTLPPYDERGEYT